MAITPTQLVPTQALGTVVAVLWTTPAPRTALVKRCVLTNVTGSVATVTLNRVPSGGAVAAGNEVLANVTVPANSTYVADEFVGMVLETGASIQGLASVAAAVNISIAGLVF